ncbi:MAG: putative lipopolysaccharide heptosyltransferase III [Verrucomicrobiae bacterium]|nr:putative lipopolysaccharide heptosyltransferase III [Verrucomicrobiae bacterium]
MFRDIKKILLVKLKHIGDALLMTPCIRALHETFPQAQISALVNDMCVPVLENHPLLGEIIGFPRSKLRGLSPARIRGELAFVSGIRQRRFDMVVDFTSSDRPAWIAWLSGARYRLAYDPQGKGFLGKKHLYTHLAPHPADPNIHEVEKNLGVLRAFNITAASPKLELHPSPDDRRAADETLRRLGFQPGSPFVAAHPTSRWLFKCWCDDRFAQLIDWLQRDRSLPVILTCGPDERELARARHVLSLCATRPRALLGELSLRQWAALVSRARLFVGVDSAPMHIAASQNIPSLALFGPTGFNNWRPWGVEHEVLVHDCPCSRDRNPHCDWTQTRACMQNITLAEAQTALDRLLDKTAGQKAEGNCRR